jgi:hypothetical protein
MKHPKKSLHKQVEVISRRPERESEAQLEDFILPLLAEIQTVTKLEKFSLLSPESAQKASQMLSRKLEILKEKQHQVAILRRELRLREVQED